MGTFPNPGNFIDEGPAMVEELPVPLTKVIQARFAVRRYKEPVFRTFPIAYYKYLTINTITRQC